MKALPWRRAALASETVVGHPCNGALQATAEDERKRRLAAEKECGDLGVAYERCDEALTEAADALAASRAEVAGLEVCSADMRRCVCSRSSLDCS